MMVLACFMVVMSWWILPVNKEAVFRAFTSKKQAETNESIVGNSSVIRKENVKLNPEALHAKTKDNAEEITNLSMPSEQVTELETGKITVSYEGTGNMVDRTVPYTEMVNDSDTQVEDKENVSSGLVFTYIGSLAQDYCVGSKIDLADINLMLGDKMVSLDDCSVSGLDTETTGMKNLTITYNDNTVIVPYGVVDYKAVLHYNNGTGGQMETVLYDYRLNTDCVLVPERKGYHFTGWYLDEEATVPFESSERGIYVVNLYAGWEALSPFVLNESGYIIDYTGGIESITDGVLNIPSEEKYKGIAAGAFASLTTEVYEVYIPANIHDIEPGAFDGMMDLVYIWVNPDNEYYCSIEGKLYTKDGSVLIACPAGLE
ncbi:MAG: InlB B-repeat-containing protein [Lachnoclostridium sp.]|nr:InlB B-repeat-containing protein [Lachnoclostridium sp.]